MRHKKKQGQAILDRASIRRLIQANTPMATALGVVRLFPGEDSHFDIDLDPETGQREVLVDVELMPRSERVLCRLGFGGDGIYRIPRVDQEVAVLIPTDKNSLIQDELDGFAIIVAVLDTSVPNAVDGDDIVVISSDRVRVIATQAVIESSDIRLGGDNPSPLDELVVGSGIDTFSGQTHYALGSTTSKAKAEK